MATAEQPMAALSPDALGASRYHFINWTIGLYDRTVDWPRDRFEQTAELFGLLVDGCLDADLCGEPEVTGLLYTLLADLKPETREERIAEMRIDAETKQSARERVSEEIGIVGGTSFPLTPETESASNRVLSSFEVLRDRSIDDETADRAAEQLFDALDQVDNAGLAVGSAFLFLLQPTRYDVCNSRNRETMQSLFDFEISTDTADYFDELEKYRAVREQFGFEEHFRHLDWFCHWAAEKSSVTDWVEQNDIDTRTTWQTQLPSLVAADEVSSQDVWTDLQEIGGISGSPSLGDYGDLSTDNSFHSTIGGSRQSDGQAVGLRELSEASTPHEVVVATDGSEVYGVGVVTDDAVSDGTTYAQSIEWIVDLTRDGDPIDVAELDSNLASELSSTAATGELTSFEELRWRIDEQADNNFSGEFSDLEDYLMEHHNDTGGTTGGGTNGGNGERSGSAVDLDRSLFVQRGHDGPFRKNLGVSLTTPLTDDLRAELRWLIEEHGLTGSPWNELEEMLTSEYVTAWGAKPHYRDVVDKMSSGDVVLYIDEKAVRYAQPIDLVLTEDLDEEIRREMAELIWRDANFQQLWFTTQPTYFLSTEDDARESVETVVREADDTFEYGSDWFASQSQNLVHVDPDIVSELGGVAGIVERLRATDDIRGEGYARPDADWLHDDRETFSEGRTRDRGDDGPVYLLVDRESLRERDYRPVVHEFDDSSSPEEVDVTPDPRLKFLRVPSSTTQEKDLLVDADTQGYVLVRDGDRLVAAGKLGCVFGKQETGNGSRQNVKIAAIGDYREFKHAYRLPLNQIDAQDPEFDVERGGNAVAPISREWFERLFGRAVSANNSASLLRLINDVELQATVHRVSAAHLVAGKNLALYGKPGTGKTYNARQLTETGFDASTDIMTAHAEVTNYDLVGGFAPGADANDTDPGENIQIDWQSSPGTLTEAARDCETSLARAGHPHWLLIDELNRANLDQAFGDIFTLLDQEYRDTQALEYANRTQRMPYAFRILATMNTSDRAKLFSLGYAFRRRFGFVPVRSLFADAAPDGDYGASIDPPDDVEVPRRDTLRALVERAVQTAMTQSRPVVSQPRPVVHRRDAVPIDPEFAQPTLVAATFSDWVTDPSVFGYTGDTDAIDVVLELGRWLQANDVAEIGHTLAIDVAQFLVAAEVVFGVDHRFDDVNGERSWEPRQWLDWAIATQILPQLDEFLVDLREEQTIGNVQSGGEGEKTAKLDTLVERLAEYGLPRSEALLEEASESYQLL